MQPTDKKRILNIYLILLGFTGVAYQSLFIREILSVFRSGEIIIGSAVFFWLLWTALGSMSFGFFSGYSKNPKTCFSILIPFYSFAGYFSIFILENVHKILGFSPGELIPYDTQFFVIALCFAPFNYLGGILFPLAVKGIEGENTKERILNTGKGYLLESLGAAMAGLSVSLILIRLWNNASIAFYLSSALIFIYLSVLFYEKRWKLSAISILLLSALIAISVYNRKIQNNKYPGQILLIEKDTLYGRLLVTKQAEQTTFYSGPSVLFSHPNIEASEYAVHLPMLVCRNPQKVLILGGGPGGLIDETLKYDSVQSVKCVELDPEIFVYANMFLDEKWQKDDKVNIVFSDCRAYLRKDNDKYDVVIMNMPFPVTGTANRFYTKEFFEMVNNRMNKGGIFGFFLTGAENYVPEELGSFLASVKLTLKTVFPSVNVFPGLESCYLAGKDAGTADNLSWEDISRKVKERNIETWYVRDYFLKFIYSPERVEYFKNDLNKAAAVHLNSDIMPSGLFMATIASGKSENSILTMILKKISGIKFQIKYLIAACILFLAGLIVFTKNIYSRISCMTVFTSGITGISLQLIAIIIYQSMLGFLYGRIAFLTGLFMTGMAIGAFLCIRMLNKGYNNLKILILRGIIFSVLILLWLYMLHVFYGLSRITGFSELMIFFLVFISGIAGGFQFPSADRLFRKNVSLKKDSQGVIYGFDLAGASLGSLIVPFIMIPLWGIKSTLLFFLFMNTMVLIAVITMINYLKNR